MSGKAEFKVGWYDTDGVWRGRTNRLVADVAVRHALDMINQNWPQPIHRVVITDGLDNVVFDWSKGIGLVIPHGVGEFI